MSVDSLAAELGRYAQLYRAAGKDGTPHWKSRYPSFPPVPLMNAVPEPLMHGVGPMPHPALQSAFDALYPKGEQWYWRADFVNEIPDEAVAIHPRFGDAMPTMKSTMHMYPIDGAAHDVGPTDTAWSYRDANWGSVFAGVDPDPANVGADAKVERRLLRGAAPVLRRRRLREHDDGRGSGARPRQLPRQLRPAGAHQGASTTRTTVFRVNQNIQPAA